MKLDCSQPESLKKALRYYQSQDPTFWPRMKENAIRVVDLATQKLERQLTEQINRGLVINLTSQDKLKRQVELRKIIAETTSFESIDNPEVLGLLLTEAISLRFKKVGHSQINQEKLILNNFGIKLIENTLLWRLGSKLHIVFYGLFLLIILVVLFILAELGRLFQR